MSEKKAKGPRKQRKLLRLTPMAVDVDALLPPELLKLFGCDP